MRQGFEGSADQFNWGHVFVTEQTRLTFWSQNSPIVASQGFWTAVREALVPYRNFWCSCAVAIFVLVGIV